MKHIKTNVSGYVKDKDTLAVINNNMDELALYKAQRESYKKEVGSQEEIKKLNSMINEILTELNNVKEQIAKG